MFNASELRKTFDQIVLKLRTELATVRSGRANPELLEQIPVPVYGSTMRLLELATITVPEPKILLVEPWDKSILKDIERAISATKNLNPAIQGDRIRVALPPLTDERRRELVRALAKTLEESRIAVRREREEVIKRLKGEKERRELSEDALFASQKDIQKLVDDANAQIKSLGEQKEKEIMGT